MVVTNYFTRWADAFAVPAIDAVTVAKTIVEHCFCIFGIPHLLHSDQGQPFTSELMTKVLRLLGLKQGLSTPYWPQANGLVERFNKTLCHMISAFVDQETQDDWDDYIPYVLFAYRTTIHPATGQTPFYMMFLRDARTPADLTFDFSTDDAFIDEHGEPLRYLTPGPDPVILVTHTPHTSVQKPKIVAYCTTNWGQQLHLLARFVIQ